MHAQEGEFELVTEINPNELVPRARSLRVDSISGRMPPSLGTGDS